MHILVRYLSDFKGILTVGFYVEERLVSIVAGKCEDIENMLIVLRDKLEEYNNRFNEGQEF
ncbi:hypothetical protein Q7A53_03800 [Halobacillus rhizosphaerae]|uniref:hypothetical protein n=1 Tax=Halobacillus rhizosphaerae TaxID=3064889 RepID=UPI00398AE1BB